MIKMSGIKNRAWIFVILEIFLILSYFTAIRAFSTNSTEVEQYEWKVLPGSSLEFEVSQDLNSSLNTIADKIAYEYNFDNLSKNFKGNDAFSIKAVNFTLKYNITDIVKDILNFSGPIEVEKYINDSWISIERYILPFFIPIEHWNDIDDLIPTFLPDSAIYDFENNRLFDEYKYIISWFDEETSLLNDLWFQWRGNNGVLSGFGISVSNSSESSSDHDSFSIKISSTYIPDTNTPEKPTSLLYPIIIFIAFFIVLTFIPYYIGERRGTFYKKQTQPRKEEKDS